LIFPEATCPIGHNNRAKGGCLLKSLEDRQFFTLYSRK